MSEVDLSEEDLSKSAQVFRTIQARHVAHYCNTCIQFVFLFYQAATCLYQNQLVTDRFHCTRFIRQKLTSTVFFKDARTLLNC